MILYFIEEIQLKLYQLWYYISLEKYIILQYWNSSGKENSMESSFCSVCSVSQFYSFVVLKVFLNKKAF